MEPEAVPEVPAQNKTVEIKFEVSRQTHDAFARCDVPELDHQGKPIGQASADKVARALFLDFVRKSTKLD